jgi:hypothetical protein
MGKMDGSAKKKREGTGRGAPNAAVLMFAALNQ